MYVSTVARPGDQTVFVPTTANVTIGQTTQTGNILAPTFRVQDTSFWAQGLNLGIEFRVPKWSTFPTCSTQAS